MSPAPLYGVGLATLLAAFTLFFFFTILMLKRQFDAARERYRSGLHSELEQFRYFLNSEKSLPAINLAAAAFGALLGAGAKIGWIGPVFGAMAGWLLPQAARGYFHKKRLERLNVQFVQALVLLANAMKAGESLVQAFESTKQIIGGPMAQELAIITGEIRVGTTPASALNNFAERVPLSDVRIATNAMLISIRTGADLPRAFNQIAGTIRERMMVHGKIEALTVQGKVQGVVAGAAPFAMAGLFYLIDPAYISVYFDSFLGNAVIAFVIIMQVVAFFVIRKIVSINI